MHIFSNKRLVLILAILFWFEISILPFLSIRGIKPDLVFIFTAFYAFQIDWKRLIALVFVLGMVRDLLANSFFGLETASLIGGALFLQFFADQFYRDERWIQALGLFSFSWFTLLLYSVFSWVVDHHALSEHILLSTFFISVYTTAGGALLFPLFGKWFKRSLNVKQFELF